jgi:hypothetical protein
MKATLAYASMVGLPLVGLFFILDAGAELEAPRSIGGDWTLTPAAEVESRRCALPSGEAGARLTILQSGGRAEVSLRTTAGELDMHALVGGGRFIARPGDGVDGDCRGAVLKLLYSGEARIVRMTGVYAACGGCESVQIVAERVATMPERRR